ncbi:hypothetical protein EDD11_005682 [Mortierella claussenii]|nr:hypothetical protein EDD11_005682 [Mortierella claussenii]
MPRTTDSKQCYSCGGVGHIQADCPSIRIARNAGGASGRCYNCGMFGHMARVCRNQPRYNGPPRYFGGAGTGGRSHINNNNTSPTGGASSNSGIPNGRIICYKCGGANHYSRDCKANGVKCYNCNNFGHLSRDCPEGPKAQVCYKCQQEGHISRDCPQG